MTTLHDPRSCYMDLVDYACLNFRPLGHKILWEYEQTRPNKLVGLGLYVPISYSRLFKSRIPPS